MNKELPCYIISDLLPLYEDDVLSTQTKKDIDRHIEECEDCRKKLDVMKTKLNVQSENKELKANPLKRIKSYQRTLIILGAIVAFILGACYPIASLGIRVLLRGEVTAYQIERLKALWYVLVLKGCLVGIVVCAIYVLIVLLISKLGFTKRSINP